MATVLTTKAFWAGVLERAAKTAAQTLAASLGVGAGLLHLDWVAALDVTAAATALSVLTSLATVTSVMNTSPLPIVQLPGGIISNPTVPPPAGPTTRS